MPVVFWEINSILYIAIMLHAWLGWLTSEVYSILHTPVIFRGVNSTVIPMMTINYMVHDA